MMALMRSLLLLLLIPFFANSSPDFRYKTVNLRGWEVHFETALLEEEALFQEVNLLMRAKLREIDSRLPKSVLRELRKVPIYFHLNRESNPGACYHPSSEWLKENKLPERWAQSVEFGVAENFLDWIHVQPSMVLHEKAHAYHHRVLGYGNAQILQAYEKAMSEGLYDQTLYALGGTVPGYAATNVQEYFAETSEAYWGTNDAFPFVRGELMRHDPTIAELHSRLWQ